MDLLGSHVAKDALDGDGADGRLAQVFIPSQTGIQNPVNEGGRQLNGDDLVGAAGNGHAQIVQQRGKDDSGEGILSRADTLRLQAELDARLLKQPEHHNGVEGGFAGVHGAVVVKTQAFDGDVVGIFLHGLQVWIGKELFRGLQGQSAEQFEDAPFQVNLFNRFLQFYSPKIYLSAGRQGW